ncbi:polysaccharide biosynthesis/export family protein [Sphingobacterium hungaricum]
MFLQTSCMVGKKIVYVNDMVPDSVYTSGPSSVLRVKEGDRLNIEVRAKTPELAAPFNANFGTYRVGDDGSISTLANSGQSTNTSGYLVDKEGKIDFPILGSLPVKGLSLDEVRDLIQNRLISDQLINEPLVKVDLLNLKVSVTGAVLAQKVIHVPDGRITLVEAITEAGGLTNNSAADKITVIREENGERKRIITNIESKDIFSSPSYYLQQNDIVFVEPKAAVNTPREERNWRYLSTVLGSLTLILSIINVTR